MFLLEGWHLPGLRSSFRDVVRFGVGLLVALLLLRLIFGFGPGYLLGIAAAVILGLAALHWYLRYRHQEGSRALVRYLISADGVARASRAGRIYLWRNYSHLLLLPDGRGAWRLHLYPTWWRLFGPPVVNARLEGLQSEAEGVRDEIQRRIDAAHRAEADAGTGP